MANGWKITAIIFIILFVVETIGIIWLLSIGINEINNENACIYQCSYKQGVSFYYDNNAKVCSCYDDAGNIVYQEVLK